MSQRGFYFLRFPEYQNFTQHIKSRSSSRAGQLLGRAMSHVQSIEHGTPCQLKVEGQPDGDAEERRKPLFEVQGRVCLLVHPCGSGACPFLLAYRGARHCLNTFSQSKECGIIQGRQYMHPHWHTSASSAGARAFMRLSIRRTQHPMHRHVHSYSGGCNAWKQGRACRTCTGSPRPCRRRCLMTEAKAQRAVVLLPGLGNSSKDYQAVGEALESRGLHVQVAKLLLSESSQRYVPWTPQDLACL